MHNSTASLNSQRTVSKNNNSHYDNNVAYSTNSSIAGLTSPSYENGSSVMRKSPEGKDNDSFRIEDNNKPSAKESQQQQLEQQQSQKYNDTNNKLTDQHQRIGIIWFTILCSLQRAQKKIYQIQKFRQILNGRTSESDILFDLQFCDWSAIFNQFECNFYTSSFNTSVTHSCYRHSLAFTIQFQYKESPLFSWKSCVNCENSFHIFTLQSFHKKIIRFGPTCLCWLIHFLKMESAFYWLKLNFDVL